MSVAERAPRELHDINLSPVRNKINRPINDLTERASERSGTSSAGTSRYQSLPHKKQN